MRETAARGSLSVLAVQGRSLSADRKIDLYPGEKPGVAHLIADIAPIGDRLLVLDSAADKLLVVDSSAGTVDREIPVLRNPYGMLVSPSGDSVFVSGWSTAQVAEYRLSDGSQAALIPVGAHPTDMVWLPPSGAPAEETVMR